LPSCVLDRGLEPSGERLRRGDRGARGFDLDRLADDHVDPREAKLEPARPERLLAADEADRDDRRPGREREPGGTAKPRAVAVRQAGALREHPEHMPARQEFNGATDGAAVADASVDGKRSV
jgi:hypothetical protein